MATRFYLPSAGAAPSITPTLWDLFAVSAALVKCLPLVTAKTSTAQVTLTSSNIGTAANSQDDYYGTWVSAPLSAQSLSGTVQGQVRGWQSNFYAYSMPLFVAYLIGSDLQYKSTIYSYTPAGSPFYSSSNHNGSMPQSPPGTVAATSIADGDRIAIDLGIRRDATASNSATHSLVVGDNAASDLPVDNSSTATYDPWIEFSQTLTFNGDPMTDGWVCDDPDDGWVPETIILGPLVTPPPTQGQIWPRSNV